jgi:hypothetical protein
VWEFIYLTTGNSNLRIGVIGRHFEHYPPPIINDPKPRMMMLARKKPTARNPIQDGSGVPPVNANAVVEAVDVIPFDSNTMSSVLTLKPKDARNEPRPYPVKGD